MTTSTKPTEMRGRGNKGGRPTLPQETALQTETPTPHTPVDAGVFRNLAGVANNLNQLTKLTHQTSLYRTNYRLKEVLDGVMEIINDYRQEKEKGQTA